MKVYFGHLGNIEKDSEMFSIDIDSFQWYACASLHQMINYELKHHKSFEFLLSLVPDLSVSANVDKVSKVNLKMALVLINNIEK